MVGAEDLPVDLGGGDPVCDPVRNEEVVDAPACVLLPGAEAVAPPAVLHLVRVQRPEAVGKARLQQLGHLGPLLVGEACVHPVGLGVLQVHLLVGVPDLVQVVGVAAVEVGHSPQVGAGQEAGRAVFGDFRHREAHGRVPEPQAGQQGEGGPVDVGGKSFG